MKQLFSVALVALSLSSYGNAETLEKHLFILSGQSNMLYLDPDVSFTPAVKEKFGNDNVIVVKEAASNQPILHWYKNWKPAMGTGPKAPGDICGDIYDRMMTKVQTAMKSQRIKSVTFVWMQGETDAINNQGEVYAASMKGLIAQLQKDLGRSDINVVIGRISDCQSSPQWTMVRKAQVDIAESNNRYAWVDTDDLNGAGNDVHYDAEGYKTLGKRFAEKTINLINNNPIGRSAEKKTTE